MITALTIPALYRTSEATNTSPQDAFCPVVGYSNVTDGVLGDTPLIYVHCNICKIGVYLPHADDVVKCTHCGKKQR